MLTTFIYSLRVLIRDRGNLLWLVAFPLILSTLFYSMFNNLDEIYVLDPLPVVIVEDDNYYAAEGFSTMVEALTGGEAADEDAGEVGEEGAANDDALLAAEFVADEPQAIQLLAEGGFLGYIIVDADGQPQYYMDSRQAGGLDTIPAIKQGIILGVLDRYVQNYALISDIVRSNPALLTDPARAEALFTDPGYIVRGSLTSNPPSDALRYYYAVLAFSCMQMMSFGLTAVTNWRANTSSLGARRSLGGQSKLQTLTPSLLAAWLLGLGCLLVGFCYIRFVFGVSFGGKEPACLVVLAISSLMATLLGALVGAVPMPNSGKVGLAASTSVILSVFAGLFGPASQQAGDYVARELPMLSLINPVRQIAEAFYSLYYYDGYSRLWEILSTLAVMSLVAFAGCVAVMRRQRFKSL